MQENKPIVRLSKRNGPITGVIRKFRSGQINNLLHSFEKRWTAELSNTKKAWKTIKDD